MASILDTITEVGGPNVKAIFVVAFLCLSIAAMKRLYNLVLKTTWSEVKEWCMIIACLLRGNNPASNLIKALHEESGAHLFYIRVRIFGFFGPQVIFPRDEGLVTHVTRSKKFVRFNPLSSIHSPFGRMITKATGLDSYINNYLASSIWCNLDGELQKRQKAVYHAYIQQAVNQNLSEKAYLFAQKFLRVFVEREGPEFNLFDMVQKLNAAMQLKLTYNYTLRTCSLDRYVEIANKGFQCMYHFRTPDQDVLDDMDELFEDMVANSGNDGFVAYFKKAHLEGRLTYDEFYHNVIVAVFLSQQTLPHATFWPIARCAHDKGVLNAVRNNEDGLVEYVSEEFRVHGPSSPILMPYISLEEDAYGSLTVPKGSVIQIMPALLHTNPRLWEEANTFKRKRFSSVIGKRLSTLSIKDIDIDDEEEKKSEDEDLAEKSKSKALTMESMSAMLFSRTDEQDTLDRPLKKMSRRGSSLEGAPKSASKQRYMPFGVGRGICPGQKLGLTTVLNSVKALIDDWDIEIIDDKGLLERPSQDHILVDTIVALEMISVAA
eukprot:CAMPEP_0178910856 /NCGR_PEP_ID=MMETSP0786-20121207/9334_1 /TAXON_ID=186022 /ORGANISM="Thalassionema frauenfeldii, Strain CCMP 1798" /LENGTH=546 /DNA_ID=CAMNT_0020583163 /DNA_START=47 /DNA_END=1688 /DNA_ORIENTATION=+